MKCALYGLDQCALYKVQSKARLAEILHVSIAGLIALSKGDEYKVFTLPADTCEFTGKTRKARQVEEPKRGLKRVHERIRSLLARVVTPDYAHAAVKGRSYRSNAEFHKLSDVAATFDVKSFYPSTSEDAVFRFFKNQLRCAADIAGLLAKLVCFRKIAEGLGCLPTGSPLSPLLSIYANKPMFDALAQLALDHNLKFTCYVDDLTFSGSRLPARLKRRVTSIIESHGHKVATEKTKIFLKGFPKHITGVVIHKGKVSVPFGRFRKARKIEQAIKNEPDVLKNLRLMQKLSGLLGEAAYLDARYRPWATESYQKMSALRVLPFTTYMGTFSAVASPASPGASSKPLHSNRGGNEGAPWD